MSLFYNKPWITLFLILVFIVGFQVWLAMIATRELSFRVLMKSMLGNKNNYRNASQYPMSSPTHGHHTAPPFLAASMDPNVKLKTNAGNLRSGTVTKNKAKHNQNLVKFPSPYPDHDEGGKYKILLQPQYGSHRPGENAVFAFAEGYDLRIYVLFVESLLATGYSGDIVLSVSHEDKLKKGVGEYLKKKAASNNVVVYTVDWECFKKNGEAVGDARGGMADCRVDHLFGSSTSEGGKPASDPRIPRPVATARYDLYWAWSLQYNWNSQIFLVDVRDAFFQLDPFTNIPASTDEGSGTLRFFGENRESVSVSKSRYNMAWISNAYGRSVLEEISDKQVICSGTTMGDQVAIESYLRAMINQFDTTKCKLKGCDQGFHNYLYHKDVLNGAYGINSLVLYDQGGGNVNTVGAMNEKPLTEWGVFDKEKGLVLNSDGTPSPVVHQFDRDSDLNQFVNKKREAFVRHWNAKKV